MLASAPVAPEYAAPSKTRLAVLGAGKMAGALVRGWLHAGVFHPENVRVYNRRSETTEAFADETGVHAAAHAADAVRGADCVLIGVKPYAVVSALESAAAALEPGCLVLSIAAGVRLSTIEAALPPKTPTVRVMPNTPALLGAGAAGFCRGAHATETHAAQVMSLFSAVGKVVEVATEAQIDAVTGLCGSGVAYFYLLIEALTDGAVHAGLPRDAARVLATQTALGAARMIQETGEHPALLKDAVTTPDGTTAAGLEILENDGVRGSLIRAVVAARDRCRELG